MQRHQGRVKCSPMNVNDDTDLFLNGRIFELIFNLKYLIVINTAYNMSKKYWRQF